MDKKRNLRNSAKTGGKYVLKGIKLAGYEALNATEFIAKGIKSIAESKQKRELVSKGTAIAASVAFSTPTLIIAGVSYAFNKLNKNEDYTAVDALLATPRALDKVFSTILEVTSSPVAKAAEKVENMSSQKKDSLKEDR